MADSELDFLLEKMEQLINCNSPLICLEKDLMSWMQFLRTFLMDSPEVCSDQREEVRDLVATIGYVTSEIDYVNDSYTILDFVQREAGMRGFVSTEDVLNLQFCIDKRRKIADMKYIKSFEEERVRDGVGLVLKEINSIKTKVREIYEKNVYGVRVRQAPKSSHGASIGASASSIATRPVVDEETLVGMDDAIADIMEQLMPEHGKHLKIIPFIGMGGLGKTTLARKLYNHPFFTHHFHMRAWACVSQDYQKGDLLRSILRSAQLVKLLDQIQGKGDEELGEKLYKGLKGRKYLIVMDDVWDIGAWNDLKRYFPEDNNGSRVVFTSRHVHVADAVHAKPHNMRFLNEQESWDLLRKKVFGKESCPSELEGIGKKIAQKCRGLPLAILVLSGLLVKSDKTLEWWRHVADSVSSNIISEPEQYMATLGLSYNHLPFHLKQCFLYFGAFPEDREISVQKLFWRWIAEGFIWKNEPKSLEEAAEDYLRELVDRSLVIISKRRCNGGIKTIHVHDLLRYLSLRKAQEEKFLLLISRFDHNFPLLSSSHMVNKCRRIAVHSQLQRCQHLMPDPLLFSERMPNALHVRSFLDFCQDGFFSDITFSDITFSVSCRFKLLRVLDLSSSVVPSVSASAIRFLVHLRYLALSACIKWDVEQSICNLWNLETFIVVQFSGWLIDLPKDIWKMVRLRHLYIKRGFKIPSPPKDGYPFTLDNLQSIKGVILCSGDGGVLACVPNIRKLKCFIQKSVDGYIHFPKLDFLSRLEKLHVSRAGSRVAGNILSLPHVEFPTNLRCLTLSKLGLPWEKLSIFGRLPNLEVLKLLYKAFVGPRWDARDGEFCRLKYLKLQAIQVEEWHAFSDHFVNLQTLVLRDCVHLREIPSDLGNILTLEVIKLRHCSKSAENSAREIEEQQRNMGNNGLKVIIHPGISYQCLRLLSKRHS